MHGILEKLVSLGLSLGIDHCDSLAMHHSLNMLWTTRMVCYALPIVQCAIQLLASHEPFIFQPPLPLCSHLSQKYFDIQCLLEEIPGSSKYCPPESV